MGHVRRRSDGWTWEGLEARASASGAERHVLVGKADGATPVELRYFRISAGAASNLESHPHEHAILVLHGTAEVLIDGRTHTVGPGDAVFIGANEAHPLRASPVEDLGFACTAPVGRSRRS